MKSRISSYIVGVIKALVRLCCKRQTVVQEIGRASKQFVLATSFSKDNQKIDLIKITLACKDHKLTKE